MKAHGHMFVLDKNKKTVTPLTPKNFSDLKLSEKHHLQKWILDRPDMLGEELFIIQEEYDGWDGTKERLDVLALDKTGSLVVVENKLDDSGKDVVWQALKYAAYCSTLTRQDIVNLYSQYFKKKHPEAEVDAEGDIVTFLDVEDITDIEINAESSQRVILTAAKFRKEVTATCLWLIDRGIDIQCMRISPFSYNEQVLLSVEQIIPPKEAQEFMVKVGLKNVVGQNDRTVMQKGQQKKQKFWNGLLNNLSGEAALKFANINAGKDHWLGGSTGLSGVGHNFHFLKNKIRYELTIANSDPIYNKKIFDALNANSGDIEKSFGHSLKWQRLDDKISSKISIEKQMGLDDESSWPEAFKWLDENMNNGIKAFQRKLDDIKPTL